MSARTAAPRRSWLGKPLALASPIERRGWIGFAALLLAGLWAFGHGLRGYAIRPFDEARPAVSAAEMALNGNWLVTHFGGQPDLWNVKPPLLIWLQAASMKLFGISEITVRLPTLAAALATLALLFLFGGYALRNWRAGLLAGAVLLTTGGYVRWHVARTGDADALLILWLTAQLVFFFLYAEHRRGRDWWLFAATLILAVMTKGAAGLAALPALTVYGFARGAALPLLRSPRLYAAAAAFLLVVGGYYAAREAATPGYLAFVWESEMRDRLLVPLNGQSGPWFYYLRQAAVSAFLPWLAVLAALLWLLLRRAPALERRAAALMLLFAGSWLVVISLARTKMSWYDAPIYPPLALVTGLALSRAWAALIEAWPLLARVRGAGLAAFALLFAWPAWLQARYIADEGNFVHGYGRYRAFLAGTQGTELAQAGIVALVPPVTRARVTRSSPRDPTGGYQPVYDFYRLAFAQRGVSFTARTVAEAGDLRPNSLVLVCDRDTERDFTGMFSRSPVRRDADCLLARIEGRRAIGSAPLSTETYRP